MISRDARHLDPALAAPVLSASRQWRSRRHAHLLVLVGLLLCLGAALAPNAYDRAIAQDAGAATGGSVGLGAPSSTSTAATTSNGFNSNTAIDLNNPLTLLNAAGNAIPREGVPLPGPGDGNVNGPANPNAKPALGDGQGLHTTISIVLLLTVLTIAPSMLVMTTSFTRIIIVLALLRQAIGTQSLPPSQVIVGLALFMTFLVMGPTFDRVNQEAIVPMQEGTLQVDEAWTKAKQPLREFMFEQIHYAGNWQDVYMVLDFRGVDVSDPAKLQRKDVDMITLVPAYILSELKVAFLMGFRLYLPFLIIDMVVSSVLISMGMLMLPPVLISLPFKLLLFVLVDGWRLVAGSLLASFAVQGVTTPGGG